MNFFKKNSAGFTFVEMLVAVSVITTGALGAFSLINSTMAAIPLASHQLTASYLAQEGIELVRGIRDNNWLEWRQATTTPWNQGLTECAAGCGIDYTVDDLATYAGYADYFLKLNDNNFYQYSAGVDTIYKREVTVTPLTGTEGILVSVVVSWQEKGRDRSLTAETELYDWRKLISE